MMSTDPWKSLGHGDARRVDSAGQYDFFWVLLEAGMPGLMFKLASTDHKPKTHLPKLENLDVSYRSIDNLHIFVLGLKERSQIDIFKSLCLDVISAGEAGRDDQEALTRVIERTRRWHFLLRRGLTGGLSVEEQRGLVGELSFLRKLVQGFGPKAAIESWTGPSGAAKDFEFFGSCIEVKARRTAARPYISVSSEDQLADVEGSRLILRVVNVDSAVLPEGDSLHDHVKKTGNLFKSSGGTYEAWEAVIYSTGYEPWNEYDERRWQLGRADNFEVNSDFPRIVPPLPIGIENVSYALSLDACKQFILDEPLIDTIGKNFK